MVTLLGVKQPILVILCSYVLYVACKIIVIYIHLYVYFTCMYLIYIDFVFTLLSSMGHIYYEEHFLQSRGSHVEDMEKLFFNHHFPFSEKV